MAERKDVILFAARGQRWVMVRFTKKVRRLSRRVGDCRCIQLNATSQKRFLYKQSFQPLPSGQLVEHLPLGKEMLLNYFFLTPVYFRDVADYLDLHASIVSLQMCSFVRREIQRMRLLY